MNNDLISRSLLIEELQSLEISITRINDRKEFRKAIKETLNSVLRIIEEQPTISDKDKLTS